MSTEEYNKKRTFSETTEPRGITETNKKQSIKPIFVVQKHDARRAKLHYDFRLEAEGVLKSWVIRRTPPPIAPGRAFAIQVEDHPIEYADFVGTIPAGEYGGGTVECWDKGTFQNISQHKGADVSIEEAIKKGHVTITMEGEKMKGDYSLIFSRVVGKTKQWFLIKKKQDTRNTAAPIDEEKWYGIMNSCLFLIQFRRFNLYAFTVLGPYY